MLLSELLKDSRLRGNEDIEILGIASDSRKIKPGFLFIALKGSNYDGSEYVDEALKKGAAAILEEKNIPDLRAKIGHIAARFYNYPAQKMTMIGITGTNGKTSCSQFLAQALQMNNIPCGIIGTLGIGFPDNLIYGNYTTPDPISLQKELSLLYQQGAKAVAMEVSSHALEQGRVNGIYFDIAIFTNLSRDHLDYHGTMQNYAAAKQKLFMGAKLKHAIINIDDEFGKKLIAKLPPKLNIIKYSYNNKSTVYAHNINLNTTGFNAEIISPWGSGKLAGKLLGKFNISNLLAVISALGILKISLPDILKSLSHLKQIPGRMQTFGDGQGPLIVIDFAHTPDALQKSLSNLREHCKGKLWCVFGCGGDRDRGKRPIMGKIAEKFSDHIIITNDNPRTEDQVQIIQDIIQGLKYPHTAKIEYDRKTAIRYAIQSAKPGDLVLIAGKGHEPYQIIGTKKIPFNDAECAVFGERVSIDTRTLQPGDIFLALKGKNFDGHDFIKQAEEKSASAAIVEKEIIANIPLIKVSDTYVELAKLAAERRQATDIPVIAITGSCGKTTTKNILGSILPNSLITQENFNNNIGVPLTLLRLTTDHKFAVIEMGANAPHEILYAAKLTQPDMAIITCAAPVHLQGFGDLDGVARVKGDILQGLTKNGIGILNADDKYFSYWQKLLNNKRCISFGLKKSADISAYDIYINAEQTQFILKTPLGEEQIKLPLLGEHNIMNALAASSAAYALNIPLAEIKNGLEKMQFVAKRLIRKSGKNKSVILDDSYSANPQSMQAAIKVLALNPGKKILVFGDMGELGDNASQYHHELGIIARESGIDKLYALGELAKLTVSAFGKDGYHFTDREQLIREVNNILNVNTTVLIKGSNLNRMWEIVAALEYSEK